MKVWFIVALLAAFAGFANAQDLKIDFNSTSQDGGPNNLEGYQAYDAGHEVADDFITQTYAAFGTSVGLTPAWPNTDDNRVQQMIDRGPNNDVNWTDTDLNLVTDFLGIDTRVASGGNGDWNGTDGTPTYVTLTLSDLPANTYNWKGYHQDTENVHVNFAAWVSTDGGANFTQLEDGYMSDSTPGGSPDSATNGSPGLVTDFAGMAAAGSIYNASFDANGSDDVVLQFAPFSGGIAPSVHNQIWGINGFELQAVPEPASFSLLALAGMLMMSHRRRR